MTLQGGDGTKATREAAEWLARLNGRVVGTDELNAFSAWRRNPLNAAAYAKAERLWDDSEKFGGDRDIALAVRDALERPERPEHVSALSMLGAKPALAGLFVILALIAGLSIWWLRPTYYETAIGEQRLIQLEDGSRLRLNTNTLLKVRLAHGQRSVTLVRGEAYFDVAHDTARPFMVTAGTTAVRDIGTWFDVRHEGQTTTVTLVKGAVDVSLANSNRSSRRLDPGEQIVAQAEELGTPARVDTDTVTSWVGGNLTFRDTPLNEAITEVNRYTRKPIELRDPELTSEHVNGTFQVGDTDAFVAAVSTLFPLRAIKQPDGRIVLTR